MDNKLSWPVPLTGDPAQLDPVPVDPPAPFPYGAYDGPRQVAPLSGKRPWLGPETEQRGVNNAINDSVEDLMWFSFSGTLTAGLGFDCVAPSGSMPEFWVVTAWTTSNNANNGYTVRQGGADPINLLALTTPIRIVIPCRDRVLNIFSAATALAGLYYFISAVRGYSVGFVG